MDDFKETVKGLEYQFGRSIEILLDTTRKDATKYELGMLIEDGMSLCDFTDRLSALIYSMNSVILSAATKDQDNLTKRVVFRKLPTVEYDGKGLVVSTRFSVDS